VTAGYLHRGEFIDDAFEPAYGRIKLANHVRDAHFNLPSLIEPK
jgi:hypothetical protein